MPSLYYDTSMMGKFKGLSEGKIWLRSIYDGKLKIYKTEVSSKGNTYIRYYFKIPNAKYPQKILEESASSIGLFKLLKMFLGDYLKEDCPTLVDLLEKKEIKEKGYARIGELYDENCGK